jgi:hypothetical protein
MHNKIKMLREIISKTARSWKLRHKFFKSSDHAYIQFSLGWLWLAWGIIMASIHRNDWIMSLQANIIDQYIPIYGAILPHQIFGMLLCLAGALMIWPLYEWPMPREQHEDVDLVEERYTQERLEPLYTMLRSGVILAEMLWFLSGILTLCARLAVPNIPLLAQLFAPGVVLGAFFVLISIDMVKRINDQYVAAFDHQERRMKGIPLRIIIPARAALLVSGGHPNSQSHNNHEG